MISVIESPAHAVTDASLLVRIATLRESVRSHKQRALSLWNACTPAVQAPQERATHGRFTQQLARCE